MEELSTVIEKLLVLDNMDFLPMRITSVLSLLSLRKLRVNQDFISAIQSVRVVGGKVAEGFVER